MRMTLLFTFFLFSIEAMASLKPINCRLPLAKETRGIFASFSPSSKSDQKEYPEGNCRPIPQSFLVENDISCEKAYAYLSENDPRYSDYNCFQITREYTRTQIQGRPAIIIAPLCFACETNEIQTRR